MKYLYKKIPQYFCCCFLYTAITLTNTVSSSHNCNIHSKKTILQFSVIFMCQITVILRKVTVFTDFVYLKTSKNVKLLEKCYRFTRKIVILKKLFLFYVYFCKTTLYKYDFLKINCVTSPFGVIKKILRDWLFM